MAGAEVRVLDPHYGRKARASHDAIVDNRGESPKENTDMTTFSNNTFYAVDGTWGDATDLIIFDTNEWTKEDEAVFAEFTDSERAGYANAYGVIPWLRPTLYVTAFNGEEVAR